MNMFDEARSLSGMIKMCKTTQGDIAKKLGVSQSYVANKLRLLNYDEEMQTKINASGISERHARAILRLEDRKSQESALQTVKERKLNVAQTEALVDFLHNGSAPQRITNAEKHSRIDVFKDTLRQSLESLTSAGIEAHQSTNFYGTKTYITICIDEA